MNESGNAKSIRRLVAKASHRLTALAEGWTFRLLRRGWPRGAPSAGDGVAIVFVNYNTVDLTAYLLFSVFRVVGRENVSRIVAVDNNSTDGSREMLELFAADGLIELIGNRRQNYHGPALNQAIDFLADEERRGGTPPTRYVWILDSDVIVLRSDAVRNAVGFLKSQQAAAAGQFQYDVLPEGYPHISALLIDPVQAWQRGISPFEEGGAPAKSFIVSLRAHGLKVADFPYRADGYLLHLGQGTLKSIAERNERGNAYFDWAKEHAFHYYDVPGGKATYERFLEVFRREVPELTPEHLLAACRKPDSIGVT